MSVLGMMTSLGGGSGYAQLADMIGGVVRTFVSGRVTRVLD
jgi:hypothetical protein